MLDKRTSVLLKKIDELTKSGGYKIIDESELLSAFPKDFKVTREELLRMLSFLSSGQFINIKYSDRGMFCMTALPSGRLFIEQSREKRREDILNSTLPFLFSFFGAFFGGIISVGLFLYIWGAAC